MPMPRTVLVVEDEALIRILLVEEIAKRGMAVVEAATGEQAIGELGAGRAIDLVVTDIRMPGAVDGAALCRWMAEHRADVPVFVTSGLDATETGVLGQAPVRRVVLKPYRPSGLADEVVAFLRGVAASA